jgi:hypothetical protein
MKIGDKVEIINYGSLMWANTKEDTISDYSCFKVVKKDGYFIWYDTMPKLIGEQGIIVKVSTVGGYAIEGIKYKYAWYDEEQLKLVKFCSVNYFLYICKVITQRVKDMAGNLITLFVLP